MLGFGVCMCMCMCASTSKVYSEIEEKLLKRTHIRSHEFETLIPSSANWTQHLDNATTILWDTHRRYAWTTCMSSVCVWMLRFAYLFYMPLHYKCLCICERPSSHLLKSLCVCVQEYDVTITIAVLYKFCFVHMRFGGGMFACMQ